MMNLNGKKALITGAAKRIGSHIALHLAQRGCDIVLHYHQSAKPASQLQKEIQSLGRNCDLLSLDLTQPNQLTKELEKNSPLLDNTSILINSASIFNKVSIDDTKTHDVTDNLHIHYTSPFMLAQKISHNLRSENKEGCIINITDALLDRPASHYSPYFSSKGALATLTKSLARELAPNIRVNNIAPGCTLFPENYSDDEKEKLLKSVPLRREGHPQDIALACEFLIQSNYITGTTLKIDGGRSL